MNKTKEEILEKHTGETGIYLTKGMVRGSDALEAMDEYTTHLTDQIKSMEGQVKELRESNDKWISAIDSRPNTDINCLVYFYNSDIKEGWIETAYFTDDYFYGTVGDNKYITHWRTLPTLPTEDNT